MLAARAYENETELRLEEVERPVPAAGEVLVEVRSAGLAPGVLAQWHRGMYPVLPRTLGNEAAGVVAEVGDGVRDVAVGDRVRIHPNLQCGHCEFCLTDREQLCRQHSVWGQAPYGPEARALHERYVDGSLAEFALVPSTVIDRIGDDVSFDAAAKVHDIADGLRAWKAIGVGPGSTVVFTAATGLIGSTFVRMAPLLGVTRLIAVARSAERLSQLEALAPGLVECVALESLDEGWESSMGLTRRLRELAPEGVDGVLDFLPEGPAGWQSVAAMKMGGGAVFMGGNLIMPPLPTIAIMVNCWRLSGNRGCTREDARQVLSWLDAGVLEVDDLITHHFPLAEVTTAARTIMERREPTWMVLIHP